MKTARHKYRDHRWPGEALQDARCCQLRGGSNGDSSVLMSKFEFADDPAHIDGNTTLASARVTAPAEGSSKDAAMVISVRKSKAMHVHRTRRVTATTEEDIAAVHLASRSSMTPANANSPNSAV